MSVNDLNELEVSSQVLADKPMKLRGFSTPLGWSMPAVPGSGRSRRGGLAPKMPAAVPGTGWPEHAIGQRYHRVSTAQSMVWTAHRGESGSSGPRAGGVDSRQALRARVGLSAWAGARGNRRALTGGERIPYGRPAREGSLPTRFRGGAHAARASGASHPMAGRESRRRDRSAPGCRDGRLRSAWSRGPRAHHPAARRCPVARA